MPHEMIIGGDPEKAERERARKRRATRSTVSSSGGESNPNVDTMPKRSSPKRRVPRKDRGPRVTKMDLSKGSTFITPGKHAGIISDTARGSASDFVDKVRGFDPALAKEATLNGIAQTMSDLFAPAQKTRAGVRKKFERNDAKMRLTVDEIRKLLGMEALPSRTGLF